MDYITDERPSLADPPSLKSSHARVAGDEVLVCATL